MKIKAIKNLSIANKLLIGYFSLFLTVVVISAITTTPLIKELIENKIKKELDTTIDIFQNLVQSAAEISIKNHLRTIVTTNIKHLELLASGVSEGKLTLSEAQTIAKSFFSYQTIGETGYIYIMDQQGNIITHPKSELIGTNVIDHKFIKQQLDTPNGYIEYEWQNPEDITKKEKALYFEHFKPWDWVISASSYKSEFSKLIQVEDLKKNIESLKFGKTGYAFIMNKQGDLLIHPAMQQKNITMLSPPKGEKIFNEILKKKNGKIEYTWKNPGEKKERQKIVYFRFIPQFDLIICASGYINELYNPVFKVAYIFLTTLGVLLICVIPLIIALSKSITSPLETFIEKIQYASAGNLNIRIPSDSSKEISRLAKYFNIFMEELSFKTKKLEAEIEERKGREEQIRILAKFPDDNPNPIIRATKAKTLSYFNYSAIEKLTGINLSIGGKLPEIFSIAIDKAFKTGEPAEIEYCNEGKTFSFTISPFEDINSAYIYGEEITAKKAYESLLVLSDAFFQNSIEGICITDIDGNIKKVNPLFTEITGYSEEEAIGKNPRILKSDKHNSKFYDNMWQSIMKTGQWSGKIWNRRKNGQAYPEWLSISAISDEQGQTINYIGIFHDITESVLNKEKIHYQTYHDATTGLPNRKLFTNILEQNINFSKKREDSFAILFVDINNFKNINDTLGHITGDRLLHLIAENLKTKIPKDMVIARFVGDKFIIYAPGVEDQSEIMKETVSIQKIIEGPYNIDEREIFCGSNIGISFFPQDGESAEILIKNAEMAMYRGKSKGKRGIAFFTPSMDEAATQRLETEHNLASALSNQELLLYYQPKVNFYTGKISGAEALLRWKRNDKIIPPDVFIPVAEETGYIVDIGEWVIEESVKTLKSWHKEGYSDLKISINLSGVQFRDLDLLSKIENIFKKAQVSPEYIKFEITESVVMSDPKLAQDITRELKNMGCLISIDDFGTGYSSLGYLKQFPVDELKIDKSFLKEFPDSNNDVSIIKSILSLAQNLNLSVTAEGVENKTQSDMLKMLGCDEIQGYYFGRPVPEDDFMSVLHSGKSLKQIKTL